ncbi:MAG: hypothetical protein ACE5WD_11570 [Candidatus Aminicenantia bacterium]
MKGREILILILIILAGVSLHYTKSCQEYFFDREINLIQIGDWAWPGGEWFNFEEEKKIQPPFPSLIRLENAYGAVEIKGKEGENIEIYLEKKIYRKSKEEAEKVAKNLNIIVDQDKEKITISTNRDEFKRKNFKTNFKIYVPENSKIEIENSYDNVNVSNIGQSTTINNRYGEVIVQQVKGKLEITNSYDPIKVSDVNNNCYLQNKYSLISAKNINGELSIKHKYGQIDLDNISKKIIIYAPYSRISGKKLSKSIEIENSYENILLEEIGTVKIKGHHSNIEISNAQGEVIIEDNYAKLNLFKIKGNLKVNGKHLSVNGDYISGEEIRISSSYQDIKLTDFSGKTVISLSHGKINLAPKEINSDLEINATYSDIYLSWPAGKTLPLEARAKYGDIYFKITDQYSYQEEDHTTVLKAFQSETDKPKIYISTTYGDIRISD